MIAACVLHMTTALLHRSCDFYCFPWFSRPSVSFGAINVIVTSWFLLPIRTALPIDVACLKIPLSCLSDWTICGFDSDRKPCLYPITWPCLSPITWSTELRSYNGTYLLFRRLQYMLIQYRVSNCTIFLLHNDRKSFLSSFLPVTSSWMRTYTSCDDVTRWRQAAFAYAVNWSNALQTEKHLIKMGFRQ